MRPTNSLLSEVLTPGSWDEARHGTRKDRVDYAIAGISIAMIALTLALFGYILWFGR